MILIRNRLLGYFGRRRSLIWRRTEDGSTGSRTARAPQQRTPGKSCCATQIVRHGFPNDNGSVP